MSLHVLKLLIMTIALIGVDIVNLILFKKKNNGKRNLKKKTKIFSG